MLNVTTEAEQVIIDALHTAAQVWKNMAATIKAEAEGNNRVADQFARKYRLARQLSEELEAAE